MWDYFFPLTTDVGPTRGSRKGSQDLSYLSVWVGGLGRISATKGWISVDRGSKATLPLTMPNRVFKSFAKDSTRHPIVFTFQGGHTLQFCRSGLTNDMGPWERRAPLPWVGLRTAGTCTASLAWILT